MDRGAHAKLDHVAPPGLLPKHCCQHDFSSSTDRVECLSRVARAPGSYTLHGTLSCERRNAVRCALI